MSDQRDDAKSPPHGFTPIDDFDVDLYPAPVLAWAPSWVSPEELTWGGDGVYHYDGGGLVTEVTHVKEVRGE